MNPDTITTNPIVKRLASHPRVAYFVVATTPDGNGAAVIRERHGQLGVIEWDHNTPADAEVFGRVVWGRIEPVLRLAQDAERRLNPTFTMLSDHVREQLRRVN